MKRLIRSIARVFIRMRIVEYDLALQQEEARVKQWPERQRVWLRERAKLSSKLDYMRTGKDLVNHQFRSKA